MGYYPAMHLLFTVLALAAAAVGLTDKEFAAALRGEVHSRSESFMKPDGKSAGRGVGAVVVDRPMQEVWNAVARFDDKPEYMPRLKSVQLLGQQPGALRLRMVVDASVTTARYTAWFRLDPAAHTIDWKLDRTATDNTIRDTEGGYRMYEIAPGRTLVVYRTYVDSGLHVPRFIQDYMMRRSVPDLLKAIKARVETGGRWRKR